MQRWLKTIEWFAVLCSLAYTILLTYQIVWSWLFAFLAAIAFLYLCYIKKIYAEFVLQIFYLLMAFYGYFHWDVSLFNDMQSLGWGLNIALILTGILLSITAAYSLKKYTNASLPWLDSFTTVFSIIATALMVSLFPENWLYWIVIDAVSVYLYLQRGLKLTALLFVVYTLLAINGYLTWI
jgi:nicotinamide mononucleotide transporter